MVLRFGRRGGLRATAALATMAGMLVVTATPSVAAVADELELDGDLAEGAATAPDWQSIFNANGTAKSPLPNGFVGASFFKDFTAGSTADSTTFATGSKDTLDITPGWQCKRSNNVTDKGDIQNTYLAAFRDTNNHLIVYAGLEKNAPNGNNNMAVWLLKDGTVGCTAGGGNTPFTGQHQNGDVLLVAAFLGGGSNPQIDAYEWRSGALAPMGSGGKCGTAGSENLCAITNDTNNVTTPWQTQDKNLGTGTTLGADQFYEMGADLTALQLNECFANYVANTRSSQELGATLYDFAGGSAATCGSATVKKYIDVDKSGTNNAGDITSGTAVSGWAMTVRGPAPSTTAVCTGTTDATGTLVCSTGTLANITPGTYTVTETQQSGFFATFPQPNASPTTFNTAATPSKTVNVTVAGGTAELGNTCFVDKTFRVTGVPTGTAAPSSMDASWSKDSGDGTAASGVVSLTDAANGTSGDGIWQGVLSDTLAQNAVIDWEWYVNGDATKKVTGANNELIGGGYPTCARLNTVQFPFTTINGSKFEDLNGNGTKDTGEHGLAGFDFKLMQGANQIGSTQTSDANGLFSFASVPPGSYTIVEQTPPTGWAATNFPNGQSVTVNLGDTSKTTTPFGNWPLSRIKVEFESLADMPGTTTDAMRATSIVCTDSAAAPVTGGSNTNSNTLTTGSVTPNQSQVTCVVTYTHNSHS